MHTIKVASWLLPLTVSQELPFVHRYRVHRTGMGKTVGSRGNSEAMPTPEEITVALESLIQQETTLYLKVRELSRSQLTLIQESNSADLLQTISQKQDCLTRIEEIERQAAPYKLMREKTLESWPPALRNRIASPVRTLQSLLGEIVALEEQGRAAVEAHATATLKRQKSAQTGKAMLNAYSNVRHPSPPGSRHNI